MGINKCVKKQNKIQYNVVRYGYEITKEDLDGDGKLEQIATKDCQRYIFRDYKKGDCRVYEYRVRDGRDGKPEIILTEEYKLGDE